MDLSRGHNSEPKSPLSGLVSQFKKLPGIGEKSALRLAFFILSMSDSDVQAFSHELIDTKQSIQYCSNCYSISRSEICHICSDSTRDSSRLCVVSEPQDVFSLEKTNSYKGVYHVLGGLISPLDGVHPEMLRIPELVARLKKGSYNEVILAINPTVEGDATVMYLQAILKSFNLNLSKLAHGLPMGADIDYADELTLQKALEGRVLL